MGEEVVVLVGSGRRVVIIVLMADPRHFLKLRYFIRVRHFEVFAETLDLFLIIEVVAIEQGLNRIPPQKQGVLLQDVSVLLLPRIFIHLFRVEVIFFDL